MWLVFAPIRRLLSRWRYPYTLPEEVVQTLGIAQLKRESFYELLHSLTQPNCCISTLQKYMPREKAEQIFSLATKKERFKQNSLYSFYFLEGWMEFLLVFDEKSRLRRLYLQHKWLKEEWEMPLATTQDDR